MPLRSDHAVAAVVTIAAAAASFALLPVGAAMFGTGFACLAVAASAVDIAEYRLPDGITAAIGLLGLASVAVLEADLVALGWRLVQVAAAALLLWLFRAGFRLLRGRHGLGLGDVKLIAAGAAWLTSEPLVWAILVACLAALLVAAVHSLRRGRADPERTPLILPFGAFLAPAFWLVWFTQQAGLPA